VTTHAKISAENGAAMAELALVLPLLLVLIFGLLDFGKAFNAWIDETHLANEGARLAAVNYKPDAGWPACPSADPTGGLGCYIQRGAATKELVGGRTGTPYAPLQNGAKVCISFPNVGHTNPIVGDPVQVTVSVNYKWLRYLTGWIDAATTPITGRATMRLEALPGNYTSGCYTPPAPS
jgi:TadE-like protein